MQIWLLRIASLAILGSIVVVAFCGYATTRNRIDLGRTNVLYRCTVVPLYRCVQVHLVERVPSESTMVVCAIPVHLVQGTYQPF